MTIKYIYTLRNYNVPYIYKYNRSTKSRGESNLLNFLYTKLRYKQKYININTIKSPDISVYVISISYLLITLINSNV